jgi:hypothetical protein
MSYPGVLGILAVFFGFIGVLARVLSPDPPPKGGVSDVSTPKMSFAEFRSERVSKTRSEAETVYSRQEGRRTA